MRCSELICKRREHTKYCYTWIHFQIKIIFSLTVQPGVASRVTDSLTKRNTSSNDSRLYKEEF